MTILILHGPNLNLLGLKSSKAGEKLTLDKVNRAIRLHVRNKDIDLKICLLYTSPSPRDATLSRMPSSA